MRSFVYVDLHTVVSEHGGRTEHVTYGGDRQTYANVRQRNRKIKRLLRIPRCRGAYKLKSILT